MEVGRQMEDPKPAMGSLQRQHLPEVGGSMEMLDQTVIEQLIRDVLDPSLRERALAELSRCRESIPDLASLLWNSFGTDKLCFLRWLTI